MTTESVLRISITAMLLLLVVAGAAAQTTSKPLYVGRVLRVVATFHGSTEVSLPVNGSRERLGTNAYPSGPRDTHRTPTILESIEAEVQRMERAKYIRPVSPGGRKMSAARAGEDGRGTAGPVDEAWEGLRCCSTAPLPEA